MPLRSRAYGWYVLALLASLNFFNYGNRNVVLSMYDDLRAALSPSNAELGLLSSVFMYTHALVTVPIGWAADRFDRRRVMALGALVWSAATVAGAAADGLGSLLVSRAIAGAGTAACVPVANALICDVFPADEKARKVSIFNLGLFLGGAAGFAIGALAGYPLGLVVVGAPGIALAVLVARVDVPPGASGRTDEPAVTWRAFVRDASSMLRIPTMRWMLLGGVFASFAAGGYLGWFVDFVAATKGLSVLHATYVFGGCALTGGLAGVVAGGLVGDRLQRRLDFGRLLAVSLGFLGALPCAVVAIYIDGGAVFYAGAWLLLFFVSWYHGPMAAVVDDLVIGDRASTYQAGFIFTMHFFGTAPAPFLVGVLVDHVGVRHALLLPTAAVLLSAAAFAGGFRSVGADRARAAGARMA